MNKRFPQIVLSLNVLIFMGIGSVFILFPSYPFSLIGLTDISPPALTDLRSVYGGLEFAIGIYLLRIVVISDDAKEPLLLCLAIFTGLAITRVFGFAIDHSFERINAILLILELLGIGVNIVALRALPKHEST